MAQFGHENGSVTGLSLPESFFACPKKTPDQYLKTFVAA
jgi:hypothetical protein